jgi:hypothetical protein
MICASQYRPFFIENLLRYLAEKILLLNATNFRGDYPPTGAHHGTLYHQGRDGWSGLRGLRRKGADPGIGPRHRGHSGPRRTHKTAVATKAMRTMFEFG